MIRFDNGPPGGDYVRYIDELMAQRAASLVAATMSSNTEAGDRDRSADAHKSPMPSPAFIAPSKRRSDAKTGARVPPTPHAPSKSSTDASQRASGLSPAAASAITSALMTRDNDRRAAPFMGAIGIAIGAILFLIGILGRTSNVVFIVAGIALVSWAIKRLGKSVAAPAASAAADAFTAMPAQHKSSRINVKG